MSTNAEKRQARKKVTAEDFTPSWLVNQMLDKLNEYGPESFQEDKSFLDPACGNGNMLVEVIKRKLSLNHDPLKALKTIYGTDIMQDNIRECRLRLLRIIKDHGHEITKEYVKTVLNNIVWTPLSTYKNGSLDYDFTFKAKAKEKDIDRWMNGIAYENWLSDVSQDVEAPVESSEQTVEETFAWIM